MRVSGPREDLKRLRSHFAESFAVHGVDTDVPRGTPDLAVEGCTRRILTSQRSRETALSFFGTIHHVSH